ncbi:hypothetical protein THITE_2109024 [Paecilomyces variotii No. 5]|uniref:Amine oxidase domain-containing protein n=1 Tax=Byssochlamys spectabilis (strain No. 5 / NBRC 109023) TaxID=1356009 RepID=V5FCR3_BYSSN|nr:hypothetical protein THITE_2109024 [Paecilomyces variotii No. 5]
MPIPDVCVVGAGMAGLRCAAVLLERGARVTILEARDRIGGRICQSDEIGREVDLGAQWIHTLENNPLLEIAIDENVALHRWGTDVQVYDSSRNLIDTSRATYISQLRRAIIRDAIEYSKKHKDKIPKSTSLLDYFVERAAQEQFPDNDQDRKLLLEMAEVWGGFIGGDFSTCVFVHRCLIFKRLIGLLLEDLFVSASYREILDNVALTARRYRTINLGAKVTGIKSRARKSPGEKGVVVTVEDGRSFPFDEVVVTAPLGWLKHHQDVFSPPLEASLKKAIMGIGYGDLEKIYIKFPRAFWREAPNKNGRHGKGGPDASSSIGYLNFLSPRYAPVTNPSQFLLEAYDLSCLPVQYASPTLLFFTWGHSAIQLTATVRSLTPNEQFEYLKTYFKPYYSLLPHYSSGDVDCEPQVILSTDWAGDELAGNGSYTNFPTEVDDASRNVDVLRYGCPDRGVWFAGEHTAPSLHMGTATGAYIAGEDVAKRIIELYGM